MFLFLTHRYKRIVTIQALHANGEKPRQGFNLNSPGYNPGLKWGDITTLKGACPIRIECEKHSREFHIQPLQGC